MKAPKTTAATQGSRNEARDRCLLLLMFRQIHRHQPGAVCKGLGSIHKQPG
jgi:hypothetical protein